MKALSAFDIGRHQNTYYIFSYPDGWMMMIDWEDRGYRSQQSFSPFESVEQLYNLVSMSCVANLLPDLDRFMVASLHLSRRVASRTSRSAWFCCKILASSALGLAHARSTVLLLMLCLSTFCRSAFLREWVLDVNRKHAPAKNGQ